MFPSWPNFLDEYYGGVDRLLIRAMAELSTRPPFDTMTSQEIYEWLVSEIRGIDGERLLQEGGFA